jgi:transposase-like protein
MESGRISESQLAEYLLRTRWPNGPVCPYCRSHYWTKGSDGRFHCNCCNNWYSITTGTTFHGTRLDLRTWFRAVAFVLNNGKPTPVRKLAAYLDLNKNTASRMLRQIRDSMLIKEKHDLLTRIASDFKGVLDPSTASYRVLW